VAIEDRTVVIKVRLGEGRNEGCADIAAEFVRLKVDLIAAQGSGQQAHSFDNLHESGPAVIRVDIGHAVARAAAAKIGVAGDLDGIGNKLRAVAG
jgi:hypothetical protein